MKTSQIMAAAVLIIGSGLALHAANAQRAGIQRTDLLQHDLATAGREAVQVRVDFEQEAASIKHSHPGEEIAYVLEGSLEYQLEGRAPVILHAGEALFIPAGVAHVAKNVGNGKASELATYVVEKGTPLVVPVK
ncbi:cupin domain-containing protein [Sinorhizobium americanum]|uniref:Quercetin dioxygenase-like cupin family protein n=1 Tax=Sinorhizobium americanum TaxID=194963 RepID=A0A4R2C2B8_9HYPH|nr:cupin domain-containing protein [Sinorhizobium americanum]TCN33703.1 quercetin dioxygenase-like cupin family protein [Sinorhizobium americanum]